MFSWVDEYALKDAIKASFKFMPIQNVFQYLMHVFPLKTKSESKISL